MPEENKIFQQQEAMEYFLGLKSSYSNQRQPLEYKWRQAAAAVYMLEDELDDVYEGRARINSPIMKWKVRGIASRIHKILFNVSPLGRIEDQHITPVNEKVVELWNKYIFNYQLDQINFKESYKLFNKDKCIYGTAVAKITQEFEQKEIQFFEDQDPQEVTIKDNTFFRPILLQEFYTDISKFNINDSQACIHSTTVSWEELRANKKRKETETFDLIDPETGEVIGQEEITQEKGIYENLNLLEGNGKNLTEEQIEYLEMLELNTTQKQIFQKGLKEKERDGFIHIDECYGKFVLDGKEQEVVCVIANGTVVIRLEPTPFKHKRYVRPFIVGRYDPVPNSFYGESNVIAGLNLLQELNASNAQYIDAKTRSIANMWYMDETKMVKWDKQWRPNGVVKGQGQNGIQPLLTPYLGNITADSRVQIQRDIDQLWSLAPVQEGTSDKSKIPSTARGTMAVIAQNDMPLNDIIDNAIEYEIKPFIEMLFERDLTFKTVEDLLVIWTPQEIQNAGLQPNMSMQDLFFDFNVKILGNLELSNEIAHQNGYMQFLNFAQQIPPIAKRLDWKVVAEKMLRSFGIKDDADNIFIDEEIVQQTEQEQAMQAQQQQAQNVQMADQMNEKKRIDEAQEYQFKKEVDTQAKITEMESEAIIERTTGQKVQ